MHFYMINQPVSMKKTAVKVSFLAYNLSLCPEIQVQDKRQTVGKIFLHGYPMYATNDTEQS